MYVIPVYMKGEGAKKTQNMSTLFMYGPLAPTYICETRKTRVE